MRKHWGLLLNVPAVLLVALTCTSVRAQSSPYSATGSGVPPGPQVGVVPGGSGATPFAAGAPAGPTGYSLPSPTAQGYPSPTGYPLAPLGYGPAGYPYAMVAPAAYAADPQQPPQPLPYMAAEPLGGYGVQPASYYGSGDFEGSEGYCPYCGGSGCNYCIGSGLLGGMTSGCLNWFLPYSEGGSCAPRWYDVVVEYMLLNRDDICRRKDFTSLGVNAIGGVVLSTDDLNFEAESGVRFTGAMQIWAGGNLEFTYFGLFNWANSAQVTSNDYNLFSIISDYGMNPFPGFDETDRAYQHSIAYSSTIDNFELHFRKRWTGPNCRLQGSWLTGVRYVYLLEDFKYYTIGGDNDLVTPGLQPRGYMDYNIRAKNSLTGFQMGGDLWTTPIPGISFGGELKTGIYGNYAKVGTDVLATTTNPSLTRITSERDNSTDVAFIGELSLTTIYRVSPNWTVRSSYAFTYLNGVALAPENFNDVPVLTTGQQSRTTQKVNDNGDILYHGLTVGVEWMW